MSSPDLNRRSFLRGKIKPPSVAVFRPPWAVDESQFLENCTRCDDCIEACPEGILVRGDGGFPTVNFKQGECTFCAQCARSCKEGAIHYYDGLTPALAWNLDVSFSSTCLSLNGIVCRICGDSCEPQAIRFQLKVGGISVPQIAGDDCTGCGACLAICPVDAVQIKPSTPNINKEDIAA